MKSASVVDVSIDTDYIENITNKMVLMCNNLV